MSDSAETAYIKRQYAGQENLAVRIRTHKLYTEPKTDFVTWVLDQVSWRGDETVLDVGCGSGNYVEAARARAARYMANDYSFGMLAGLRCDGLLRVNANAEQLPYASDSADTILANHMIYHIADQNAAVRAFRRVLKPGGVLLAATNAATNMAELNALLQAASVELGARQLGVGVGVNRFTLENGATLLQTQFETVTCHVLDAALLFPAVEPVIDYLATTRERHVAQLPSGVTWNELAAVLTRRVQAQIDAHGVFRVSKRAGVFVCR